MLAPPKEGEGPAIKGITFDRFLMACVTVKHFTEAFRKRDVRNEGRLTIDYNTFVSLHYPLVEAQGSMLRWCVRRRWNWYWTPRYERYQAVVDFCTIMKHHTYTRMSTERYTGHVSSKEASSISVEMHVCYPYETAPLDIRLTSSS
jgi:hypothetical protein